MWFYVDQIHIDEGIVEDANYCPIALCMKEAGFPDVNVTERNVRLRAIPEHLGLRDAGYLNYNRINLPEEAREFITEFDEYGPEGDCEPFSFELEDVEDPKCDSK